jgi:hypothetical protein
MTDPVGDALDEAVRRREAGLDAGGDLSAEPGDPALEEVVAGFVSRAPSSRLEPLFEQAVEEEVTERGGGLFGSQIRRKERTVWHLTEVGSGWPAISIPVPIPGRTGDLAEVKGLRVLVVTRKGRLLMGLREEDGALIVGGWAPRTLVAQHGTVRQFPLGPLQGPDVRQAIIQAMGFRPDEWLEVATSEHLTGATGALASGPNRGGSELLPAKLAEMFATTLMRWADQDARPEPS